MTSVSSPAATSAKVGDEAPALICAPCYICLEDGPDEKGQPLIRACSCRGETSAGYHLSCIISYAKAKTKEAVETYEAGDGDWDFFGHHWMKCVNCKREYEESLCVELAKGMVDYVASLVSDPDTHFLHYRAKQNMLTHLSSIAEHAKEAQNEIMSLLRLWRERKGDIVRRLFGKEDVTEIYETICHMREKASLLDILGAAHLCQKRLEEAIATWEQSLETKEALKSLVDSKNNDNNNGDDGSDADDDDEDDFDIDSVIEEVKRNIELVKRRIRDVKVALGSIERSDEYRLYLRDKVEIFLKENNLILASKYKSHLAAELLWNKEPPEYEEAIGLLEEASEDLERILGPSHKDVAEVNGDLAEAKEAYKKHLASNDSSKDDNAGRKRKRDDQE